MPKLNRKLKGGLSSVVFSAVGSFKGENVCFLLAFWVTEIPLSRCHCLLLPPSCCKRLCPAIFKILNSCFVFSEVFQAQKSFSCLEVWQQQRPSGFVTGELESSGCRKMGSSIPACLRAESRSCRREGEKALSPRSRKREVRRSVGVCRCFSDARMSVFFQVLRSLLTIPTPTW